MKAKLLKKMRKRFIFYYDRHESTPNPWKVYDKVKKKQVFGWEGDWLIPTYNEKAQYSMLLVLGYEQIWRNLRYRKEVRQKEWIRKQTQLKFEKYDQSRQN